MTVYDSGSVVPIVFPLTSVDASKKRLAVVMGRPSYQETTHDIVLAALTSQVFLPGLLGYKLPKLPVHNLLDMMTILGRTKAIEGILYRGGNEVRRAVCSTLLKTTNITWL